MRTVTAFLVLAAAATLCLASSYSTLVERTPDGMRRTDRLVVKFHSYVGQLAKGAAVTGHARLDSLNRLLGCRNIQPLLKSKPRTAFKQNKSDQVHLVQFNSSINIDNAVARYLATGLFEFVEPDYLAQFLEAPIPDDPEFYRLWWLRNTGKLDFQEMMPVEGADLSMPEAWEIEQGDSAIIAAIIDSGCKRTHPDFSGRIWRNPGEVPDNNRDDDENGYVDDVEGWDFGEEDNDPQDTLGHGTAVAGALGATGDNGYGLTGIDWNCKLMILRVGVRERRWAAFSQIYEAIMYAAIHGARVINLSLGHEQRSSLIEQAIDYAVENGTVVVAAAGNDNATPVLFPARYEPVIAVGSSSPNDHRTEHFLGIDSAGGSNYGPSLDVLAPGDYIIITRHNSDSDYIYQNAGTSFAAPMVSGLAALLFAQKPLRSVAEVRAAILETADDQVGNPAEDTPGWDQYYGYGRVNAFEALRREAPVTSTSQSISKKICAAATLNSSRLLVHWTATPDQKAEISVNLYTVSGKLAARVRCQPITNSLYTGVVQTPIAIGVYSATLSASDGVKNVPFRVTTVHTHQ